MSQWSELPNEILSNIFNYSKEGDYEKQKTLGQCALTCRSWRLPAQILYFETIRVSNIVDLNNARYVLNCRRNDFPLGVYVKKVLYRYKHVIYHEYAFYRGCGEELLNLIDTVFPNIEVLNYDPLRLPELRYLFFFLSQGKFNFLKQVPTLQYISYFERHGYAEIYRACVKILKERNKKLYFFTISG